MDAGRGYDCLPRPTRRLSPLADSMQQVPSFPLHKERSRYGPSFLLPFFLLLHISLPRRLRRAGGSKYDARIFFSPLDRRPAWKPVDRANERASESTSVIVAITGRSVQLARPDWGCS